jgi:hypothetical protein
MRPRVTGRAVTAGVLLLVSTTVAPAHDAPLTGAIIAVDVAASTVTVRSAADGTSHEVRIHVTPDTRIVRFSRIPGRRFGFVEHAATLTDLRPGWTVSVTTHHDGDTEVAQLVRVLHEASATP